MFSVVHATMSSAWIYFAISEEMDIHPDLSRKSTNGSLPKIDIF